MPGGRPTKYDENVLMIARDYIKNPGEDVIPTVAGLSVLLDVSRECLYEWKRTKPEFSDTLTKLNARQHQMLVAGGLDGTHNAAITKLILATNHGYSDKSEHINTMQGPGGGPIEVKGIELVPLQSDD